MISYPSNLEFFNEFAPMLIELLCVGSTRSCGRHNSFRSRQLDQIDLEQETGFRSCFCPDSRDVLSTNEVYGGGQAWQLSRLWYQGKSKLLHAYHDKNIPISIYFFINVHLNVPNLHYCLFFQAQEIKSSWLFRQKLWIIVEIVGFRILLCSFLSNNPPPPPPKGGSGPWNQ